MRARENDSGLEKGELEGGGRKGAWGVGEGRAREEGGGWRGSWGGNKG